MLGRQAKQLEAFRRVVDFVTHSPPPDANGKFAELSHDLERVVLQLEENVAQQSYGARWRRATTQQLRASARRLRERHLRPLATIARAMKHEVAGIEKAVRLPRRRLPVTILLAEARAMRESAERYATLFVEMGRDHDFLSKLDEAIAEVERVQREGGHALGYQVGSTAGIDEEIHRARRLVMVLECQILEGFANDAAKLAEWGAAKRVQLKPGPRREAGEAETKQEVPENAAQLQLVAA